MKTEKEKEAEEKGFSDYVAGIHKAGNPYKDTESIFIQSAWLVGWNKAQRLRNR